MRSWDVTGLYKAQRDRQPPKRSRRRSVPGTAAPPYELIPGTPSPRCKDCGDVMSFSDYEAGATRCEDCATFSEETE